jgi:hypothetical protein
VAKDENCTPLTLPLWIPETCQVPWETRVFAPEPPSTVVCSAGPPVTVTVLPETLVDPSAEQLEQELSTLELLDYCRAALQRRSDEGN